MFRVRLNDGTIRDCKSLGEADGYLHLDLPITEGSTLMDEIVLYSNPFKTQTIAFLFDGIETLHTGYTTLCGAYEWLDRQTYHITLRR